MVSPPFCPSPQFDVSMRWNKGYAYSTTCFSIDGKTQLLNSHARISHSQILRTTSLFFHRPRSSEIIGHGHRRSTPFVLKWKEKSPLAFPSSHQRAKVGSLSLSVPSWIENNETSRISSGKLKTFSPSSKKKRSGVRYLPYPVIVMKEASILYRS